MNKRQRECYARLLKTFSVEDLDYLLRLEKRLSRWGEMECNGDIRPDSDEGDTYHRYTEEGVNPGRKYGATIRPPNMDRAEEIAARYGMIAYHQNDPRGCSLYMVPLTDIPPGKDISCMYTRGIAICL